MLAIIDKKSLSSLVMMSYGFIAALTYIFVSISLVGAPIIVMPLFVGVSLCCTLPFSNYENVLKEFHKDHIIRPILFSIGQILVVGSLSSKSAFATFVSTAAGTIVAVALGKVFLREKISFKSYIGVGFVLVGIFFLKKSSHLPMLALLAGVIQGSGVFFARRRSLAGARSIDMASASLVLLFVLSLPIAFIAGKFFIHHSTINAIPIIGAGLGFAFLQTSYCFLSFKLEAWMLSLVGNTRIPASVIISALMATEAFSWMRMLLGLVVLTGVYFAYAGMSRQK